MSDVARCPFCKKLVDNTLTLDVCPKCNSDLEGIDLEPVAVEGAIEPVSFWDNPSAYFFGFNRSTQTVGGVILAVIIVYFFGLLGALVIAGLVLLVKTIFKKN